ncbi:MAG: hypothetical protein HUJ90_03355 [Bacteroidales bacterium]|nr:hypothetical protein [Bacteroidales bacterium]
MKKKFLILLSIASVALSSCYSDLKQNISDLESRVAYLETVVSTTQTNISEISIMTGKLEKYIYVSSYNAVTDKKGNTTGYEILFSDGEKVSLYYGEDWPDPVVGIREIDGLHYWTTTDLDGNTSLIYDSNHNPICCSVVTPLLKIENDTWLVSYDAGETWSVQGPSIAADGRTFVNNIYETEDYVVIDFTYGDSVSLPKTSLQEKLAASIANANENMIALQTICNAIQSKLYIANVIPIKDGETVTGYSFVLSNDETFTVYNGQPADMTIKIKKLEDGNYYWYYSFGLQEGPILNGGNKVQVGVDQTSYPTPTLSIEKYSDNKYYWKVKLTAGSTAEWLKDSAGNMIPAQGSSVGAIESVSVTNGQYADFVMVDGENLRLPMYQTFEISIDDNATLMGGNSVQRSVSLEYSISPIGDKASVTAFGDTGFVTTTTNTSFNAETNTLRGVLTITAPDTFNLVGSNAKASLIVSDGLGHTKVVDINIVCGIRL